MSYCPECDEHHCDPACDLDELDRPDPPTEHCVEPGFVAIAEADERDPFDLLHPEPKPMNDFDAPQAIRSLGDLESTGQLERWEAARRQLSMDLGFEMAKSAQLADEVEQLKKEIAELRSDPHVGYNVV